jgi:hypothetical protein
MDTENRPVLMGLLALVVVSVVLGVLGGLAVMLGVDAAGVGERSAGGSSDNPATFRLPKPSDTGSTEPAPEETQEPSSEASSSKPAKAISLSVGQQSVSPMQQIDLTGTYASEGAILQVQRFENGSWSDFPVTVSVSGGTFSTFVQTGRLGPNKFRVVDSGSDQVSDEVTVTVG